jgi:putative transposase
MMKLIRDFLRLLIKILRPSGAKSIMAENILLRQQLISIARHHSRSPKLTPWDRIIYAVSMVWINPKRLLSIAVVIKPATLLKFHQALVKRKYSLLFSRGIPRKPGPKGPEQDIIDAIIEMK